MSLYPRLSLSHPNSQMFLHLQIWWEENKLWKLSYHLCKITLYGTSVICPKFIIMQQNHHNVFIHYCNKLTSKSCKCRCFTEEPEISLWSSSNIWLWCSCLFFPFVLRNPFLKSLFPRSHPWPSCHRSTQRHLSSSSVVLLTRGPVVLKGPGTFRPLAPLCGRGRTGSSWYKHSSPQTGRKEKQWHHHYISFFNMTVNPKYKKEDATAVQRYVFVLPYCPCLSSLQLIGEHAAGHPPIPRIPSVGAEPLLHLSSHFCRKKKKTDGHTQTVRHVEEHQLHCWSDV